MSKEMMAFCDENIGNYGGFFLTATNTLTVYAPDGEVFKTIPFEGE